MHNSTLLKLFFFLLSCLTVSAQTTQQQKPNSTKAQLTPANISLNLTTILTHYSLISSSLPSPSSSSPSPPKLHHPSNSSKNHPHHLCLSTTLSSCPANSLCIKNRCRCRLGYRLNLDGHCVLHHCLENSHDCDRYFPNTVCVEPAHRCVCESDYYLDQPTQKCLFNGPAAEQRRFWSMVITGAMMSTVFVFCCLVCKAKAVGGDNNDRVDNGGNGQVRRRGVIRGGGGSHVPPPPPSSSSSSLIFPPHLHDSPPDYFGIKNFPSLPQPPPPPPPPPYTP